MEYTKKVLNKFFGLIKKDKRYYDFFKENLNNVVISLRGIHLISWRLEYHKNYTHDFFLYRDIYEDILRKIFYPHWINKLNEFLEILNIKTDVEKFCLEHWGTSDINLVLSKTPEFWFKWDNLMYLRFLNGIKDYDTITDLWLSYSCRRFYYKIKI